MAPDKCFKTFVIPVMAENISNKVLDKPIMPGDILVMVSDKSITAEKIPEKADVF
jgi:hypothetical protein